MLRDILDSPSSEITHSDWAGVMSNPQIGMRMKVDFTKQAYVRSNGRNSFEFDNHYFYALVMISALSEVELEPVSRLRWRRDEDLARLLRAYYNDYRLLRESSPARVKELLPNLESNYFSSDEDFLAGLHSFDKNKLKGHGAWLATCIDEKRPICVEYLLGISPNNESEKLCEIMDRGIYSLINSLVGMMEVPCPPSEFREPMIKVLQTLKKLVDAYPASLDESSLLRRLTPLELNDKQAGKLQLKIIQSAIAKGAEVNACNAYGFTPLTLRLVSSCGLAKGDAIYALLEKHYAILSNNAQVLNGVRQGLRSCEGLNEGVMVEIGRLSTLMGNKQLVQGVIECVKKSAPKSEKNVKEWIAQGQASIDPKLAAKSVVN